MSNADKLKALQLTLDKLEKSYGKGTIMKLGDTAIEPTEVISTGSIGLDIALGVGGPGVAEAVDGDGVGISRDAGAGDVEGDGEVVGLRGEVGREAGVGRLQRVQRGDVDTRVMGDVDRGGCGIGGGDPVGGSVGGGGREQRGAAGGGRARAVPGHSARRAQERDLRGPS